MGIQELGSIGEFVASIGVLITLIFLAFQMRQNTIAIRRSNARQTTRDQANALGEILDAEVAALFLKGQKSLDDLSELERYRFDLAFTIWLQSLEQAYADYDAGSFSTDHLVPYENAIPAFLTTPGGSAWWEERRVWFNPRFRKTVERLCETPAAEAATAGPPSTLD